MEICEGPGWRLQTDPARPHFPALIGSDTWAVELSAPELGAIRRAILSLRQQWLELRSSLMPEEQVDLEVDLMLEAGPDDRHPGNLHVALSGDGGQWALRFVLTPAPGCRAVEGGWSAPASSLLAAALERLPLMLH
ncbi:MAG: DUF1818 family protein [Synechococcus sp. ELA057]|jgi:hypothetical protein